MTEVYDVNILRSAVEKKLEELVSLHKVDSSDVLKLQKDDKLATRFLNHTHGDLKAATELVYDCFQWRKQSGVASLNVSCFPKEVLTKDGLYFHSEDLEGHRIFYMRVKEHVHVPEYQDLLKRYVLWMLEKEYWRDTGAQIVVLFDMGGAGLKNIDMDLVKFILACFQTNFPNFLARLMVYELPLVLTAAWKIIQGWLSAAARKKVVFVKKKDIQNYISPDKLWCHMGGMDNFKYTGQESVKESRSETNRTDSQSSNNPDSLSNSLKFTSSTDSNQINSFKKTSSSKDFSDCNLSDNPKSISNGSFEGRFLSVSPGEEVIFRSKKNDKEDSETDGCFTETLKLTNTYSKPVVFKIKTTSPNEYRIRPGGDMLECGTSRDITIQYRPTSDKSSPTQVKKQSIGSLETIRSFAKLQILALPVPNNTPAKEALDSMKNASQEDMMQHKIICRHESTSAAAAKLLLDRPPTAEDFNQLMQKMDERMSKLELKMSELILYQKFVISFIVISMLVILYF